MYSLVKRYIAGADLDAEAAAKLISAASDVALLLDPNGVIADLAFGSEELSNAVEGNWAGRTWLDTVSADSRSKVEALLREAATNEVTRWRQINHPSADGGRSVLVQYCALRVGGDGRIIAVGRNLLPIAELQQRLVSAQQSLERDYWRLRQVETRYRMLFQMASEAVLIVDAATGRIEESNPIANELLGDEGHSLVGETFPIGLDSASQSGSQTLLSRLRKSGRSEKIDIALTRAAGRYELSVSPLRQGDDVLFLVRISNAEAVVTFSTLPEARARLLKVVDSAPDGVVVTDSEGHVLTANAAFLEMAQLTTEDQAHGALLGQWLGRRGAVDFEVLIANLRRNQAIRLFSTSLSGEHGLSIDVEVSAITVNGEGTTFGFVVRDVGRRLPSPQTEKRTTSRTVEQLMELVGRVPLKELVRESTDLIEKLCIEAALELAGHNRASAAELLGLSRQSLYVKLRRYGFHEYGANPGA
jgi:transcriptional regulator PpsR